ncbi:MAG: fluoride efflux transporter CrcB [Alphaproteobacteria bacterium]|nr:fluoride efflux transporter CrcB [Alphaproteobacteria bacterium]|tara:strand:- start:6167 stop:6547 length:381 start_codon:yes stop_codon:yes gene_type:complete
MKLILAIAAGGAIGAVGRHYVGIFALKWLGAGFPFGTLFVNVVGSFAMGVLIMLMALKWNVGNEMRAFFTVGLLGGFTTFSAFSLDFAILIERGEAMIAVGYVLASVVLAIFGIFAGMHVMRALAT